MRTSLARRRREQPMQAFDNLPACLRLWLHGAALPWSPASVLRLWRRALAEAKGDREAARARLDRAEARLLARDAAAVWGMRPGGVGHPAAGPAQNPSKDFARIFENP